MSDNEIDTKFLNNLEENNTKDFFNLSLNEILHNWTLVNVEIIKELIEILSLEKYKLYFNNIEDGNSIYLGIYEMMKDIINTLVKEDRGYYMGITLILISIVIYYIYISSNNNIINK